MNRRRFIRNAAGLMALPSAASAAFLTISGEPKLRISNEEPSEPEDFDFYISPTGSDSNSGTMASPWAITALNSKSATYAGKRVGLLDGTYNVGGITPHGNGITLGPASGTSGQPTVIEAVNHGSVVLDHNHARPALMGRLDNSVQYIQIRGLKFIRCTEFGIFIRRDSGRIPGIVIDSCEFTQQTRSDEADLTNGIFLQCTDDALVTNCYFHDIVNTQQASSVSAILMYGTIGTVVERCTFESVYAGVHSKYAGGSPRTDDQSVTVRQCYFASNQFGCRGFDNKDQVSTPPSNAPYGPFVIEHNVFENCTQVLGNDGPYSSASPMIVRNNTVYANSSGAKQGFSLYSVNSGAHPNYYNNIWVITGSASWAENRSVAITVNGSGQALADVIDYNCYSSGMQWTTQEGYGYVYYGGAIASPSSQSAWQNATNRDQTGRSLFSTNPLFTMTGSGADRFKLQGGSPCLGAGRVGGVSGGDARNMGAWDGVVTQIGCDFA